ncbi:MAG: ABC transporter ATP-binding protein [Candidatus Woesearchaeota archaeon]
MKDKASFKDFFRVVFSLAPSIKGLALILFWLILVIEALKFVAPYLVKLLVDGIVEGAEFSELLKYIIFIFIFLSIQGIIGVYTLKKTAIGAAREEKGLLSKIFNKILGMPLSWHEKQNTGTLVSKLNKASNYIAQLAWFVKNDILPSLIQLVLTGVVLFWVDYRLGLIYLAFTPIILYYVNKHFKKVQPYREKYHKSFEDGTKIFAQSLYNIKTVKDYVSEDKEFKEHKDHLEDYVGFITSRTKVEFWQISFRDILSNFVRAITTGVAAYLVTIGTLSVGDLIFVITIIEKAFINLHRLGYTYTFMGDTFESLNRALDVLETKNFMEDEGKSYPKRFDLKFKDVSFSYEGDEEVLSGLNIDIPPRKTTALVGPSGSGKTTLIKLISRQYDVSKGSLKLGGIDIKDIPLSVLRRNIAFVSQQTEIFDRTIFENIAYSRQGASREEVILAAKRANAYNFIMSFKNGFDTLVGERGVRLSGGQQQRISIARALLSNAKIIIFDEATSSLDSESEKSIQEALLKIKGRTVIIIAHRLSTVEHSDNIIVLKDGVVLEQGSHKDLLNKKKGLYKKMIDLQKLGDLRS